MVCHVYAGFFKKKKKEKIRAAEVTWVLKFGDSNNHQLNNGTT